MERKFQKKDSFFNSVTPTPEQRIRRAEEIINALEKNYTEKEVAGSGEVGLGLPLEQKKASESLRTTIVKALKGAGFFNRLNLNFRDFLPSKTSPEKASS